MPIYFPKIKDIGWAITPPVIPRGGIKDSRSKTNKPLAKTILQMITTTDVNQLLPIHNKVFDHLWVDKIEGSTVQIGEREIKIKKRLGWGGTKSAYDAEVNGVSIALILPTVDETHLFPKDRWNIALKEPASTRIVRNLGICTNPICEAVPVLISGNEFIGLVMMRYQDLPYKIIDLKDPQGSTLDKPVLPKDFSVDSILELLSPVIDDFVLLEKNSIHVVGDSLNACVDSRGNLRVYLSDLVGTVGRDNEYNVKQLNEDDFYKACLEMAGKVLDVWNSTFWATGTNLKDFDKDTYEDIERSRERNNKHSSKICSAITRQLMEKLK